MSIVSKKAKIIITIVVLMSIGYFFYQKSHLTQQQFYIYISLLIIGTIPLFFRNRYIKILGIPGIIGIGFMILLGFLPLYRENINDSNFYLTQKTEYIFLGNPNNIELKEFSEYGEQTINPTKNNQSLFFPESTQRTIIINEKINNSGENNKLIITFPDNTIYIAYPGSETNIEKINNLYKITKDVGKIEYYQPDNAKTQIITNNSFDKKNESEFSLYYLIENYEKAKFKYITNQAGGFVIMQPLYQRFSKKLLDISYYIRPEIYQKNIDNYEIYKQYFKRETSTTNYKMEENWFDLILQQAKKGQKETNIFK